MFVIQEREFKKKLSLFSTVMLGIGSTIGAGIFVLLSPSFNIAGPGVIIAFALNAVIALIIAGNYAEAASFNPIEGGGFSFVEEAYGKKALFLGWVIWLGNTSYAALVSIGMGELIAALTTINETITAVLTLLVFTGINIVGSKKAAVIEKSLALVLVIALIVTGAYLFTKPVNGGFTPLLPKGLGSIIPATSLLFVVFTGFEAITTISAEIKYAKKNIPKALFITIAVTAITYLFLVGAVIYSTNVNNLPGDSIALLEAVKGSRVMEAVIIISALLAMLSTLNVAIMAASRNVYALSRDKFLPKGLSKINEELESPVKAIMLSFIVSLVLVLSNQVEFVASVSNLAFMIVVSSVGLAVLNLRKHEDLKTYKIPFYPYSSYLCIILPLILIPFLELQSLIVGLVWVAIGLIIHKISL